MQQRRCYFKEYLLQFSLLKIKGDVMTLIGTFLFQEPHARKTPIVAARVYAERYSPECNYVTLEVNRRGKEFDFFDEVSRRLGRSALIRQLSAGSVDWHRFVPPGQVVEDARQELALVQQLVIDSRDWDKLVPLDQVTEYVQRGLGSLGGRIIVDCNEIDQWRSMGGEHSYNSCSIRVDAEKARAVFDFLFRNEEMAAATRSDIEPALRTLESSFAMAKSTGTVLSLAQKELIQYFVKEYIDPIKEQQVPGKSTAKEWISYLGDMMRVQSGFREFTKESLRYWMGNAFQISTEDKGEFEDCLYVVVRVYAGMANLESALKQTGTARPSLDLIRQAIDELF
jgi:hypothetical protein